MEVGAPRRIYRVEPVKEPVPVRREPVAPPAKEPKAPAEVPAK
jgi:hypothetical protein